MDEDVFVLADMTVEVHDFPQGRVIGFNGVTEWALDSIEQDQALWLPSEGQLRELLGGLFSRLERAAGSWTVTYVMGGVQRAVSAGLVEEAYGLGWLEVLTEAA
jgi:hypothetical protein